MSSGNGKEKRNNGYKSNDIYIGNIPSEFDDMKLFDLFRGYRVLSIRNFTKVGNKVFAFLKCVDQSEVKRIIEEMNNHEVEGRQLKLRAVDRQLQDEVTKSSDETNNDNSKRPPLRPPYSTSQPGIGDTTTKFEKRTSPGKQIEGVSSAASNDRPPPLEPVPFNELRPRLSSYHSTAAPGLPNGHGLRNIRQPSNFVQRNPSVSNVIPDEHRHNPYPCSIDYSSREQHVSSPTCCLHNEQLLSVEHGSFPSSRVKDSKDASEYYRSGSRVSRVSPTNSFLSSNAKDCKDTSEYYRPGSRTSRSSPTNSYPRSSPRPSSRHSHRDSHVQHHDQNISDEDNASDEVVLCVANFPYFTKKIELFELLEYFEPIEIDIVQNTPTGIKDDFTYALVTLPNMEMANAAIIELDNTRYKRRTLVVEILCDEDLSLDEGIDKVAQFKSRSPQTLSERFSHLTIAPGARPHH